MKLAAIVLNKTGRYGPVAALSELEETMELNGVDGDGLISLGTATASGSTPNVPNTGGNMNFNWGF